MTQQFAYLTGIDPRSGFRPGFFSRPRKKKRGWGYRIALFYAVAEDTLCKLIPLPSRGLDFWTLPV